MLVISLVQRARKEGLAISPSRLMGRPTAQELAALLDAADRARERHAMTARPVLDPGCSTPVDLNDPRLHAEFDLDEVWRYLRTEKPFHRQGERGTQPGFWC